MADVHGELVFERVGDAGAVVALVHGGAGPELTWSRQSPLADRMQLLIPWRRGYPPSPAT
jgi:hypothetical protein